MRSSKPILLVEDDKVDAMTIRRSLETINITNDVDVANNGEEALQYLRDPQGELPCIILLDLNMPKMNGIEFLRIVKHDETLKRIPVVILTTSRDEQDKIESFNLGVAGYMIKPVDYWQFVEVVKAIDLYWTLSKLPNGSKS
jgi:CheY-like chemotaxis protein